MKLSDYAEALLGQQGRRVEVINLAEDAQEDLLTDLVSIIYSFCARLLGSDGLNARPNG